MLSKSKSKVIKINNHIIDLSRVDYLYITENRITCTFQGDVVVFEFSTERDAETIFEKIYLMMKGD